MISCAAATFVPPRDTYGGVFVVGCIGPFVAIFGALGEQKKGSVAESSLSSSRVFTASGLAAVLLSSFLSIGLSLSL